MIAARHPGAAAVRQPVLPVVDPVIVALYGLLAVAACGRSGVQLGTRAAEAPLAYGLSAAAAALYVVASLALRRSGRSARALAAARVVCSVELAGVVLVGTLTLLSPDLFPRDTVWSDYGAGYAFAPVLLPAATLLALARHRARAAVRGDARGAVQR